MSLRYEQLAPGEGEVVRPSRCREDRANILSKILFHWANSLIGLGAKRPLLEGDLEDFTEAQKTHVVEKSFDDLLEDSKRKGYKRPILRTFVWFGYKSYLFGIFLKILSGVASLLQPILLRWILDYLQKPETQVGREHVGYLLAVAMFVGALTQSLSLQYFYWIGFTDSLRYRGAVMISVLKKVLKLTGATKRTVSTGTMTNLVAVDANRIQDYVWNPHDWWYGIIFTLANIIMLYWMIGISTLAGVGSLILLIPINSFIVKANVRCQEKLIVAVDGRVSKVTEALEGIRLIKLYNWEECFKGRINQFRDEELVLLKKIVYLKALSAMCWIIGPAVVSFAVFACYSLLGGDLTPGLTFSALSVMNNLRDPIGKGVDSLSICMNGWISTKRFEKFMNMDEVEHPTVLKDNNIAIQVQGDYSWTDTPTLSGLDFKVPKGELLIVVGSVGSGKTSLLGTILGEVKRMEGSVEVNGKIVHTTQSPWLMNASLRDNITFFRPFEKEKYERTISCSALVRDLQQLPGGDQTEIGERGINLSGGQKQRLALARAVYRHDEADIYLFDEPLGAVDPTVADQIFHECIRGVLKDKTRILVTHQLQFLPYADCIYVMKNGRIEQRGTYQNLMESGVDFTSILKTRAEKLQKIRSSSSMGNLRAAEQSAKEEDTQKKAEKEKEKTKLIQEEERDVGGIDSRLYLKYFKSGNTILFFIVIALYLIAQVSQVMSSYWLVWWSAKKFQPDPGNGFYLGIYTASFFLYGGLVLTREVTLGNTSLQSSRNLHNRMLACVFRAPMSFFDSTPLGRIINRFSRDQEVIDSKIATVMSDVGNCGLNVVSTVIVVCVLAPFLTIPMAIIAVAYFFIQRYYRNTARELKRMEAVSKSPIFAYFSEAASGVSIIRGYGAENEYLEEFRKRIDNNTRIFYWHFATNRWLGMRLEIISSLAVFLTAIVDVFSSRSGSISTAMIGLSISYTLSLTANLNWSVRQFTEMEVSMNSISRVINYTELEPEAPLVCEDFPVPEEWPKNADIKFNNFFFKYTPNSDNVLKGITCNIDPKEKIGIVGRTGAGKSSLTSALFRLVEGAGGDITIDGVNISQLGLSHLRTTLSIIPQDPLLFCGTIRFNLDPLGKHSDNELWQVLQQVQLKEVVQNFPNKLDQEIVENGDNFSLGQKQLVSLVRVILRRAKILILDEATASLDLETDEQIQSIVRTEFKEATVLTIAHRLETIVDSDRVMVLDKGELKEMGKPEDLLQDPNTIFSRLVESSLSANEQSRQKL